MTPERADDLLARLLDGALGAAEHRELLEAALQEPALGRRLAELLKLQPFLVDALAGPEGEDGFVGRVRHALLEQSDTAFIRAVVQKAADPGGPPPGNPRGKPDTRRRRFRGWSAGGRSPSPWLLLFAAAALLLGLALLFSSPSDPVKKETVRREPPRERVREPQSPAESGWARAAAERQRVEEEMARISEARRKAETVELQARTERKAEEQSRAEAELRRIAEEMNASEARLAKAHQEEQKAAAADPSPRDTKTAIARLERAEGDVQLQSQGTSSPLRRDQELLEGQGLDTRGKASRAVLRYGDRTRVEVRGDTRVRKLTIEGGKRFFVEEGSISAEVAKQPKDQPLVIATPYGEATIVGTSLRIVVDPDPRKGMRLDVEEGKVELKNLAGKTVMVESGFTAVAALGMDLTARRLAAPLLSEDFQDRRHVATEWDAIQGGLPLTYANGFIEIDTTPRAPDEYPTTWHTPGGLRSKKSFPLPLRIALDVDMTSNDHDVTPVLVLKPVGSAFGPGNMTYSAKDVLQVARRKDVVDSIVGNGSAEVPIRSAVCAYRPGAPERWVLEISRDTLIVSVNGIEIMRELHKLDAARRYQVGLEASAKKDVPSGIKVRFDNVVIERADR